MDSIFTLQRRTARVARRQRLIVFSRGASMSSLALQSGRHHRPGPGGLPVVGVEVTATGRQTDAAARIVAVDE